jgi:uncharacterized protein (TIGR02118 family)
MYKLVAFLKRRPGMSVGDFRDYYENTHAPLARTMITGMRRYVRRYLTSEEVAGYPSTAPFPFDVITELWFDSEAGFLDGIASLGDPRNAEILRQDELKLFDREAGRQFVVDECESEPT